MPTVTSVVPSAGPLSGGTSVNVYGSGFTGTTSVAFGSVPASSFFVISDNQLVAVSPMGPVSTTDITVTSGTTSATSSADLFTYVETTWQTEMTALLRACINDWIDPTGIIPATYTDQRLWQVLVVSAFQVNNELSFQQKYQCIASSSAVMSSITPDPTLVPYRSESFINLSVLKAACITDRGNAIINSKQAIMIKDGDSVIDLRDLPKAQIELLKNGWCKAYEDAREQYLADGLGYLGGAAVMGPFRVFTGYSGFIPFGQGFGSSWR